MKLLLKIILGGFVLISTLLLCAGLGAFYYAQNIFQSPYYDKSFEITIPQGSHIAQIVYIIEDATLTHSSYIPQRIFIYGARITGQATKLKAGEYKIPANASMQDILDILESGKVILRQVTIREGLTSHEITTLLASTPELKIVDVKTPKEGTLLPETYSFQKGETNADILKRMRKAMTQTIDRLWPDRAENLPFNTKEEAIILASIVEKETAVPSERKRVAGVFINRLKRDMLLQTDPTVIYAMTMGAHQNDGQGPIGRRLLRKDLSIDSPYNTYKYAGLPPGPIANPGEASIRAVLHPEEHDYIYFVADGSGGHAFAKTLDGHNNNVAKWRKIRKTQK